MLSNHLFWLAIALLVWSGFNLNVSMNFQGASNVMKNIIQWVGVLGLIAGLIHTIMLCIHFNWWWLLGIIVGFFVLIGVISALIRGGLATIVGVLGIIGIPIVWWLGGMF